MSDPSSRIEALARAYQAHLDGGGEEDPKAFLASQPGDVPGAREALDVVWRLHTRSRDWAAMQVGPYQVEEELGRGAQGTVFRAHDPRLDRAVALKILTPSAEDPAGYYLRFQREAASASRIEHPNVCTVYEAGVDEGRPYIAMQLVEGTPLSAWRTTAQSQRASMNERLALLEQVAGGLAAVHDAGLVHRDVKPGNIIVTPAGVPVLVDFGLARSEELSLDAMTRTGDLRGTPAYMAPEQIVDARQVDARTDVYALGVVAYELLTGERPFRGATINELISEILRAEPVRPAGLPRDVWTVVRTALDKDPGRRYAGASDLAEDLRRERLREPIRARPPGPVRRAQQWARRRPAIAATLALVVGGALFFAFWERASARTLEREKQQVERERENAVQRAYLANIQAADASLSNYDVAEAERRLRACPEPMRGWEWRYLDNSLDESMQRIDAHRGSVRALRVSPDGSWLATVGADGALRRWATDDLALLAEWQAGGSGDLYCLAVSPDGHHVATGARNGKVTVWTTDGRPIHEIHERRSLVFSLAFSADGSLLFVGNTGNELLAHDLRTSRVACEFPYGSTTIRAIRATANGDAVWYGTSAGELMRGDATTGASQELVDMAAQVWDLDVTPDDRTAILGLSDGRVVLVDAKNGAVQGQLTGHRRRVTTVGVMPGGRCVSASLDGTIRIWRLADRKADMVFVGHRGSVNTVGWCAPLEALFTGGDDGTVRRWELVDEWARSRSEESEPQPRAISVHPDGRTVALGGSSGQVFVHDLWSGDIRSVWLAHKDRIRALVHSPSGRLLVSAGNDRTVRVWDARTHAMVRELRMPDEPRALAIHPRKGFVAVAGLAGCIRIWDLETGAPHPIRIEGPGSIHSMSLSPDGETVAVARPQEVVIHRIDDGAVVHRNPVRAIRVCHAPGGDRVALMRRKHVEVWDLSSNTIVGALRGHLQTLHDVAWHPTEYRIATASRDQTVRIWDSERFSTVSVLREPTSWIRSIAWGTAGASLVAASSDNSVQIWRSERPPEMVHAMRERRQGQREAAPVVREADDAGLSTLEALALIAARRGLTPQARAAARHEVQRLQWRFRAHRSKTLPWSLLERTPRGPDERSHVARALRVAERGQPGRWALESTFALADLRAGNPAGALQRLRRFGLAQDRVRYARSAFATQAIYVLALLDLGEEAAARRRAAVANERWEGLARPGRLERALRDEVQQRLQSSDNAK